MASYRLFAASALFFVSALTSIELDFEHQTAMFSDKVRRLFQKLNFETDSKVKTLKKKQQKRNKKEVNLPDTVLNLIFDYSSPIDVAKWRSVNTQFNRIVEKRDQAVLYLDVLRLDIHEILPQGVYDDGDFFKHSSAQIIVHSERRSILLAVHSHWTTHDAVKILAAVRYYGRYAKTVSLDASIAELCVAGQCSTDIAHWFTYQTAAGSTDPSPLTMGSIATPASATDPKLVLEKSSPEASPQWNPRTQRIPIGALLPCAREVCFRASIPQLRRLRRLAVYRTKSSCIFSPNTIQLFRLSITAGKKCPPTSLRLRPFLEWLDTEALAGKYCTQFC